MSQGTHRQPNKRRVFRGFIILLIAVVCVVLGRLMYMQLFNTEILEFSESYKNTLNPGRGFYNHVVSGDLDDIRSTRADDMTMILLLYDIGDYKTRTIDDDKLAELRDSLETARDQRLKVILRVAYGFESTSREPKDLEIIRGHIKQIEPFLKQNAGVLYSVQAGLLGPWGEWHNSTHGNPPSEKARSYIVNLWLEILPDHVFVQVRRPSFIRDLYGYDPLDKRSFQRDVDRARVGWHNDALVSTPDDYGTYSSSEARKQELDWSYQHNQFTPFGGETNYYGNLAGADNSIFEFARLRISYLNSEYHPDVLSRWQLQTFQDENAYEYIQKHLGYRLILDQAKLGKRVRAGRKMPVQLQMKNVGFAPIYLEYNTELVLKDPEGKVYQYPLDININEWNIDSSEFVIRTRITLPAQEELDGEWMLGIAFQDALPDVQNDNLYAIELSNHDVTYIDGVNYFAHYSLKDKHFELISMHN